MCACMFLCMHVCVLMHASNETIRAQAQVSALMLQENTSILLGQAIQPHHAPRMDNWRFWKSKVWDTRMIDYIPPCSRCCLIRKQLLIAMSTFFPDASVDPDSLCLVLCCLLYRETLQTRALHLRHSVSCSLLGQVRSILTTARAMAWSTLCEKESKAHEKLSTCMFALGESHGEQRYRK